jgi:hypothetical protein
MTAPGGPGLAVPPGGGGRAGWTLDVRPAGPCWGSAEGHVVASSGSRVFDPERSAAVSFHRCTRCHTGLLAVGVGVSSLMDRRWYELVDPCVESERQALVVPAPEAA